MHIISGINQVNYGSYREKPYWNLEDYRVLRNGKPLSLKQTERAFTRCLRLNWISRDLIVEFEFLLTKSSGRFLISVYDRAREISYEKSGLLPRTGVCWNGFSEQFQLSAKSFGADLLLECGPGRLLRCKFQYLNLYRISFQSSLAPSEITPLRSLNPFNLESWSFTEKQALLPLSEPEFFFDGTVYDLRAEETCLHYSWTGGYFPPQTQELYCQFQQSGGSLESIAGSLLVMGQDTCSSESAVWVGPKKCFRLPRVVPAFGSPLLLPGRNELVYDSNWNFSSGRDLELQFLPFQWNRSTRLVFPVTQRQRIYGRFFGCLRNQFDESHLIDGAVGFLEYRKVHWRKR